MNFIIIKKISLNYDIYYQYITLIKWEQPVLQHFFKNIEY